MASTLSNAKIRSISLATQSLFDLITFAAIAFLFRLYAHGLAAQITGIVDLLGQAAPTTDKLEAGTLMMAEIGSYQWNVLWVTLVFLSLSFLVVWLFQGCAWHFAHKGKQEMTGGRFLLRFGAVTLPLLGLLLLLSAILIAFFNFFFIDMFYYPVGQLLFYIVLIVVLLAALFHWWFAAAHAVSMTAKAALLQGWKDFAKGKLWMWIIAFMAACALYLFVLNYLLILIAKVNVIVSLIIGILLVFPLPAIARILLIRYLHPAKKALKSAKR